MNTEKYNGKDNYGNPKQLYLDSIGAMGDAELYKETRKILYLSALAANNPKSDFHWMIDAIYDEWVEIRYNPDGYSEAYDDEYAANFG
jgi:hypothetical protein